RGVADSHQRVIGKILTDREILQYIDAERAQMIRRADAGAHEYRWTSVCAGGEDDMACFDNLRHVDHTRTFHFSPVELDAIDVRAGADGEIAPRAGGSEVRQRRALPHAVLGVARKRTDADRTRFIVIRHTGVA